METIIIDGVEYKLTPVEKEPIKDSEEERIAKLPKTWEESFKLGQSVYVIGNKNKVYNALTIHTVEDYRTASHSRNQLEATIALMQLIWLRDIYNGDWKPKLDGTECYSCISYTIDGFQISHLGCTFRMLIFKTDELAKLFLENFIELLEKTKDLY